MNQRKSSVVAGLLIAISATGVARADDESFKVDLNRPTHVGRAIFDFVGGSDDIHAEIQGRKNCTESTAQKFGPTYRPLKKSWI